MPGKRSFFVRRDKLEIKVEVNFVLRGTVHPVRAASLTAQSEGYLSCSPIWSCRSLLSLEDLYGGKLVAALDRQHPRDLFNISELFRHEGITPGIRRSFVAYLACHNRPIHEVLDPNNPGISADYDNTFRGMTAEPVELRTCCCRHESA